MARSHARIYTSIWSDTDFIALSPDAQRMFLFLISQPDLEHSGIIALRERRWSRSSAVLSAADVRKALDELAAARFVVFDEETEELLVRSLMRWDGVWKQPNVAKAAATQIRTVASAELRQELRCELVRLEGEVHSDSEVLRQELVRDLTEALHVPAENPSLSPSATPSGTPSATPSATPSRRVQGKGNTGSTTGNSPSPSAFPRPPSAIPDPVPPPAAGKPASAGGSGPTLPEMLDDPPESAGKRANRLTQGFAELRPLSNFNAAAGIVRKAVNAGYADDVIAAALRKVIDEGHSLTAETLRRAIEGGPKRPSAGASSPPAKQVNYTDEEYSSGWN